MILQTNKWKLIKVTTSNRQDHKCLLHPEMLTSHNLISEDVWVKIMSPPNPSSSPPPHPPLSPPSPSSSPPPLPPFLHLLRDHYLPVSSHKLKNPNMDTLVTERIKSHPPLKRNPNYFLSALTFKSFLFHFFSQKLIICFERTGSFIVQYARDPWTIQERWNSYLPDGWLQL